MIIIRHSGSFNNTERFLKRDRRQAIKAILESCAQEGVLALSASTPIDSGVTANSWGFSISTNRFGYRINWTNSNVVNGVPIAIVIQYGHAGRNGSYVEGRDYINPAIRPIFNKIGERIFLEVNK